MTDGYDGADDADEAADAAEAALRERLRSTDPARSLPPADPDRVTRLLEETMDTETEAAPIRETGARGRSPLTWVVAAAAVVLIAGAALFGVLRHDDTGTAPSAGPQQTTQRTTQRTTTELVAPQPTAYRARCMAPNADLLAQQTLAFDGTVRSIEGDVVTLDPAHFYAGEPTDLVTVRAPSADLRALIAAVRFEQGGRYLVAASGDTVAICGMSATWSPGLAALYHRAFEGG